MTVIVQTNSTDNALSTRSLFAWLRTPPGLWFLSLGCLLGLGLWLGFLLFGPDSLGEHFGDQHRYKREAENLLESWTFAIETEQGMGPTAVDGPIYACFLMPFLAILGEQFVVGVAVAQFFFSLATAYMIAQITLLITDREWVAGVAMLSWCVYPFAVVYSTFHIIETFYTACLVACVLFAYLFARDLTVRWAVALGIVLGLTSLTRPNMNANVPLLFLALFLVRRDERRNALKGLILSGVILVLVLSPWIVRNYVHFGRFPLLSSQVGRMLYLANNPKNETGGVLIPRDAEPPPRQEPEENEVEWNERLSRLAKEFIRENPGRFLHLCGMRLYKFWRVTPMYESFRSPLVLAVCLGSFLPLFVFAVAGFALLRDKWRLLLPLLAVILSTYALHVIFGVSLRYRFPIEALLIPPAAYAVSSLFGIHGREGERPREPDFSCPSS